MAQLDSYKGLWFATFDPQAPSLREYLGEMAWYIDTFVDRREGGIEVLATHNGHAVQLEVPGGEFRRRRLPRAVDHLSAVTTGFSAASRPTRRSSRGWCRPATATP